MSGAPAEGIDSGTAYGLSQSACNKKLVEVGPGTPMGELMRRYWQPVFKSEDLTSDRPHRVRVLGEDLILFRNKQGEPGLVHERCRHRGASLFYGRVEDDGIRCCYHGWKFDVKGNCLEQPCERDGGQNRQLARQPWYAVEERYGLVYAYMGPPEKKPVLPRYEHLETIEDGMVLTAISKAGYGPLDGSPVPPLDFNWLQSYENSMDSPHVPWLHYHHSGDQFPGLLDIDDTGAFEGESLPPYAFFKNLSEVVIAERTERGVKQGVPFPGPDGNFYLGFNEAMVPNVIQIFGAIDLMYNVPVDDTHFKVFALFKEHEKGERSALSELHNGKTWWELTEDEHRQFPGDYEAQGSIGALPAHNHELLTKGDVAIVMLRRRLEEAVRDVAEGRDPPGVTFASDTAVYKTSAANLSPFVPKSA